MMKRIFSILLIASLVFTMLPSAQAKTFGTQTITNASKPWTITFSDKINYTSTTNLPIYILTGTDKKHPVSLSISDDFKKVTVTPMENYTIGENYTLFISKNMYSTSGKQLNTDTSLSFQLRGTYIQNVQATWNPFVTNIFVQSTKDITTMKFSVNGSTSQKMIRQNNDQFELGQLGLAIGDKLTFYAYNNSGQQLEIQSYIVK